MCGRTSPPPTWGPTPTEAASRMVHGYVARLAMEVKAVFGANDLEAIRDELGHSGNNLLEVCRFFRQRHV